MTLYTIIPAITIADPEQVSPDLEKIKTLAKEFITKYGADCNEVVVVEIKEVGRMQYTSPIWIDGPPESPKPQHPALTPNDTITPVRPPYVGGRVDKVDY